jgi:hypothetical protein
MKRFLVTYLAPASVIAEWKKTDPAQRRDAETKTQAQWKKWMARKDVCRCRGGRG